MGELNKTELINELKLYIRKAESFEKCLKEINDELKADFLQHEAQINDIIKKYPALLKYTEPLTTDELAYLSSTEAEQLSKFIRECEAPCLKFQKHVESRYAYAFDDENNLGDGRFNELIALFAEIASIGPSLCNPHYLYFDEEYSAYDYRCEARTKTRRREREVYKFVSAHRSDEKYPSILHLLHKKKKEVTEHITFPLDFEIKPPIQYVDNGHGFFDNDSMKNRMLRALDLAIEEGTISTSMLNRKFGMNYGIAARIIDSMERAGYIGSFDPVTKERKILITQKNREQLFKILGEFPKFVVMHDYINSLVSTEFEYLTVKTAKKILKWVMKSPRINPESFESSFDITIEADDLDSCFGSALADAEPVADDCGMAFIESVAKDFETFSEEANKLALGLNKEQLNIELEAKRLLSEEQKVAEKKDTAFVESLNLLKNKFEKIIYNFQKYYKYTKSYIFSDDFSHESYDENLLILKKLINELNEHLKYLNDVDFDAEYPPVKINIEGESFYTYINEGEILFKYTCDNKYERPLNVVPYTKIANKIFSICDKSLYCIDLLIQLKEKNVPVLTEDLLHGYAKDWMKMKKQEADNERLELFCKFFTSPEAEARYKKGFDGLKVTSLSDKLDLSNCCKSDNNTIAIGNALINVDGNGEYASLVSQVPIFQKHVVDGGIATSVKLNLKKCGNVMLELKNTNEYDSNVKAFVEQLILQYLLSFPANRLKLKLVDPNNKMEFSSLKNLTKVSADILMDGIIRDDRQLDDAVRDIENLMFDIEDNKLSANGVGNLFDYNKEFEANPQSYHLFVFVDFPYGAKAELLQRMLKIVQSGNKAGIFSIFVYNHSALKEDRNGDITAAINNMASRFTSIFYNGDSFELLIENKNKFLPDTRYNLDLLPEIITLMQNNAKVETKKNILIDSMFDYTDSVVNSEEIAAQVLDIPIGARGRDVQTLCLRTTDPSAHAVVIGSTGSGKSVLLHTLILSACYKYSPEELNLYLVDFKGGNEFKFYEANGVTENQLPHIKLTGLTNEVEDGIAILSNLKNELESRQQKFRKANVSSIVEYCRAGYKMPRLFVIIDEIQVLFEQEDSLQMKSVELLSHLFKEGRTYGISILWASQNIPSAVGLKDKVLSQIKNRISLKLNEPEDARLIKIDPKAVMALNRPEKGLAVINDDRTGEESAEFRVAFSEDNFTERMKHARRIIDKWSNVTAQMESEPLFIVGGDETPSPIEKNSMFAIKPTKESLVSKAEADYNICFGQNYITGKPFKMGIELLANKSNFLCVGKEMSVIRDIMGYSLLSVVMEHITNSDNISEPTKIYYSNGERFNSDGLLSVIKDDFADVIENVTANKLFENAVKSLYKIYSERREELDTLNEAKKYSPYFFVIHSLQNYIDLFEDNPTLTLNDSSASETNETMGTNSGLSAALASLYGSNMSKPSNNDRIPLVQAFKELLGRGGRYGIHFIISMDDPDCIQGIPSELYNFKFKALTKGLRAQTIHKLLDGYSKEIHTEDIALVAIYDERYKVKMYRYNSLSDSEWYKSLAENYLNLKGNQ